MEWLSDIFTMQFAAALASIIVIDLVLAGDNAILIALAARNLPPELQKKAIMWGAAGAIVVRALMTLAVVWLLKIPGLMLVGGLALVWIAWKLLADDGQGGDEHGAASTTLMGAMKTIIIADAVMGIDNVLAIAGASHGSFLLVVLGLLISVPVVVWGSGVVLRLIERFPIIIYGGAAVLAYTAAHMIVAEPVLKAFFASQPPLKWAVYVVVFLIVLGGGWLVQRRRQQPA
ncbi:TerC family protein [Ralstonia pickettii]|uniref:TerC family protein n=1 Tax=Ralstonia pickettii TaxID=329 RepID=UPI0015B7BAD9|nr:TerC family protein [Ralstonia pickettii]NWK44011.1 TerC family protein [Ralstonia pickettii]